MGDAGADSQRIAGRRDAAELGEARHVDHVGGRREALLHRRDQRLAASDVAGLGGGREELGCLGEVLWPMIMGLVHDFSSPQAAFLAAACSAIQTFCGVAGMLSSLVPMASVIALIIAGGEPIAPASPQPLTPSGLLGAGVVVCSILNE